MKKRYFFLCMNCLKVSNTRAFALLLHKITFTNWVNSIKFPLGRNLLFSLILISKYLKLL